MIVIISKTMVSEPAKEAIKKFLVIFEAAPVNRAVIEKVLASEFKDFEDAALYVSARHAGKDELQNTGRQ